LLEALARAKLNGSQHRIIDVILRNTYGYGKKTASLSDGFLAKATGLHCKQINREINMLINFNILYLESKGDFTNARVVGINKNYSLWSSNRLVTTNKIVTTNGLVEKGSNGLVEKVVTNPLHKKEILKKDIYKDIYIPFQEIIDYLNTKTDSKYKHTSKATQKHIRARWNEDFKLDDFKKVIDKKVAEWNHSPVDGEKDMRQYLRPETLFGTKFEGYLNQKGGSKSGTGITEQDKQNPGYDKSNWYAKDDDD
jgi:phage replication O-like protein O